MARACIGPPSALPTAQASGSGPGGTLLPAGFPLPSGYTLVSNVESDGQIIVVLGVSSPKDAYDFYKGALPGAGYQVTDQGGTTVPTGGFIGTLAVSNASYDGTIAFTPGGPSGQTVTIQLRRLQGAGHPLGRERLNARWPTASGCRLGAGRSRPGCRTRKRVPGGCGAPLPHD